jgi:hypothetical protein
LEEAMTDTVDLRGAARRPHQYWNIDGLPELGMGLLWILWGSAWLIGEALPRGRAFQTYWMFTPVLLVLSSVAVIWAIKRAKARLTFPRTGYVEWKPPTRTQRVITAAVALGVAAALTVLRARNRDALGPSVMPWLGILIGVAFVVASVRQRAPHLLVLAGAALALGLTFGALDVGWEAANWLFVCLGVVTALVGAVRLGRFLKRHPVEPTT